MVTTFFGSSGPAAAPRQPPAPEPGDRSADIQIQPLSETQWLACDQQWSHDDARNLLAYIEEKADGHFELMHLRGEFRRSSFSSLEEALVQVSRSNTDPHSR